MEIKIISDAKTQECDVLVVNMYEGKKTTEDIANKYALEEDKFEGKFGTTYLLPTYGKRGNHTTSSSQFQANQCLRHAAWHHAGALGCRLPGMLCGGTIASAIQQSMDAHAHRYSRTDLHLHPSPQAHSRQ